MTWTSKNSISPEAEYLYRQARDKIDDGEYQHAVAILHQAVEITPQYLHALIEIGNCLDYLSQYDDAVSYYEKVIAADPFHAEAWFNKGMSLKKMGRDNEALPCIERGIELYCGR